MKQKLVEFREHPDFWKKVEGGYDFYEWTRDPDFACWSNEFVWNVHHHGIWVMDYWPQDKMQEAWSHGIVHLKRVYGHHVEQDCAQYATKYAGKDDVKGIRMSQAFGCLYGRAFSAVESYLANVQLDCATADDVQESSENND